MSESSPFEFFRGEISSQDVEVRADAMGKSHLIASLMRPQSVRSDLFPLLNERIETEMDQVLLQMTESLTKMFDQMGGSAGLNSIAPIYSKLFVVEETVVRNAAAASAVAHFERMKNSGEKMDADTAKTWLNLASNIISPPNDEEKDVFYPRCAIPSVISSLYAVLSDETDKETRFFGV